MVCAFFPIAARVAFFRWGSWWIGGFLHHVVERFFWEDKRLMKDEQHVAFYLSMNGLEFPVGLITFDVVTPSSARRGG